MGCRKKHRNTSSSAAETSHGTVDERLMKISDLSYSVVGRHKVSEPCQYRQWSIEAHMGTFNE